MSIWLFWLDPLINRDAIIYLRAAQAYMLDGLAASQSVFDRPLLAICIAKVHQLTGLPLLYAGLLITTLFYVLLCVAFVDTVRVLGGKRSVQLIAAVVILSHPWINHTRASIMRDPIYLTFMLLSLRELLLFARQPSLAGQLRWVVYVLMATLFRFEGAFLAILAPLALLLTREVDRPLRRCLQLTLPCLLLAGLAGGALLVHDSMNPQAPPLFPSIGLYVERLLAFPQLFADLARQSAEPMLAFTSRDDAPLAALAALAAILLINLCRAVTWPWVLTLLWGLRAGIGHRFRRDDLLIIGGYLTIVLLYLCAFVVLNRFMLERYATQAALLLMLFLPFLLSSLWHRGGWRKYLVLLLLLGMSADTLHSSAREKLFIIEATRWINENTREDATIVSNEKYIAHFSGRNAQWQRLQRKGFKLEAILATPSMWRQENYMVMYIRKRQEGIWAQFIEETGLREQRAFDGGDVGRVVIVTPQPLVLPAPPQ